MKAPIKELPTFTWRTYRGGAMIREFLRLDEKGDSFYPEDWISSFTVAKNPVYVENEGISRVVIDGKEDLITNVVTTEDFGNGRDNSGVLIKLLDSAERLGIQVHPNKKYAKEVFNSEYGKTECWHILDSRTINGEDPCIYLGFKEYVTKEMWRDCFIKQDIPKMLSMLHKFTVKTGDTILVTGGTPHAIGAGCFMLEIQEPSDYTMRTEKVTLAGEHLTPMQIHYGVGEEKLFDCFDYTPTTREQIIKKYFLSEKNIGDELVTYDDTPCFALKKLNKGSHTICCDDCLTVLFIDDGGIIKTDNFRSDIKRGNRFFIPSGVEFKVIDAKALLCFSPKAK